MTRCSCSHVDMLSSTPSLCRLPATPRASALPQVPRWGFTAVDLPNNGRMLAGAVNVVSEDKAKKESRLWTLLEQMPRAVVVVDEVDTKYGESKRTSAILALVDASLKAVMMTATPIRSKSQQHALVRWLRLCREFPITERQWVVAAADAIVHKRVDLGIEVGGVAGAMALVPYLCPQPGPALWHCISKQAPPSQRMANTVLFVLHLPLKPP